MDPRPAPVVTVTDPSQPGRPPDVLVVGEQPPAPDPARGRRRRRTAVAVLLLTGVVAAGAELRERRAAEVTERRLAGTVSLDHTFTGFDAEVSPDGIARLTVRMRLFNSGPRPVTVVAATSGDFTAADDVDVPPSGSGDLALSMSADCPVEQPPPRTEDTVLVLDVRTGAGVQRQPVFVPQDAGRRLFSQVCGWGSLAESVHLAPVGVVDAAGTLALEVGATTRPPVRLLALRVDDDSGTTLVVPELAGGPVPLPRWSPGGDPARTLQAQVGIWNCDAARAALLVGGARLTGVFEDVNGQRTQLVVPLDGQVLEGPLAAGCS